MPLKLCKYHHNSIKMHRCLANNCKTFQLKFWDVIIMDLHANKKMEIKKEVIQLP